MAYLVYNLECSSLRLATTLVWASVEYAGWQLQKRVKASSHILSQEGRREESVNVGVGERKRKRDRLAQVSTIKRAHPQGAKDFPIGPTF